MTARPKPRPDGIGAYEPNGAAAKAGLNKSILDAGWGIFLRVLSAKAESAGRQVIAVDPRHTSQRCAQCGHIAAGNRVTQAEFRCLGLRPPGPRRRERGQQHLEGRACPPGSLTGNLRSRSLKERRSHWDGLDVVVVVGAGGRDVGRWARSTHPFGITAFDFSERVRGSLSCPRGSAPWRATPPRAFRPGACPRCRGRGRTWRTTAGGTRSLTR